MIYTLLNTGYKYVAVSALLYLISIEKDISKPCTLAHAKHELKTPLGE